MFLNKLQQLLKEKLPGQAAQNKMAPNIRNTNNKAHNNNTIRESAVLILIYRKDNCLYIPFIERSVYDGAHSGQISLPGGKAESFDIDLKHTALRETYEEIGIHTNEIEIIGQLTSLYIPNSNFNVSPFIGSIEHSPFFDPDPIEVESIIEAPLEALLANQNIKYFEKEINEHHLKAPYFNINNHKIWGATAMIISELKELIIQSQPTIIPSSFYNAHNAPRSH